ncbi:MAG TPA: hypothetical protein PLN61_14800 [bacterium]|nr:hypothetical protein [bacterium]
MSANSLLLLLLLSVCSFAQVTVSVVSAPDPGTDGDYTADEHRIAVDGTLLASGLYYCRLEAEGRTVVQKK